MVALPVYIDPVIEAMREQRIAKMGSTRDYIGASEIGNPCARAIWYNWKKYPQETRPAHVLWAADDGHRTESVIADRLRAVPGITLRTCLPNGDQYGFKKGNFAGHVDGLILGLPQAPKTWHVWENKAKNQKGFDEFLKCISNVGEKRALQEWSKPYYVQAQCYMHAFGLTRHYLTVALAGARDVASCRTEYDKETALAAFDRAEKIASAKSPPPKISDKPDYYICRMCQFRKVCHEDSEAVSGSRAGFAVQVVFRRK